MSIQKPYSINIKNMTIDANNSFLLQWKTSGDTSASFSIDIYKNSDSTSAYSLPRTYSFANSFLIPSHFVINGQDYKLKITVYNTLNQSASSDYVLFTTSSSPVVTVDAIPTITNHAYLFTATYTQVENVSLQSYIVNLYTSDQVLLNTSGILTDGLMQYRFDLMKSGLSYFVEFVVTSSKGLVTSSGLLPFSVFYENPYLNLKLQGENVLDKAGIYLSWEVLQVIGKTTVAPIYVNNEEIDLRNGKVFFDEGFDIANSFTLKLWFREVTANVDLIYMKGSNGVIRVQFQNDARFHMFKEVNGFTSHYATQPLSTSGYFVSPYQFVLNDVISNYFLCIQQVNGKLDLICTGNEPTNTPSGTTFSQLNGVTFNALQGVTF